MPLHRVAVALADRQIEAIERSGEVIVAAFPEGDTYVIITHRRGDVVETRDEQFTRRAAP